MENTQPSPGVLEPITLPTLHGVPEGALALALAELLRAQGAGVHLHICGSDREMDTLASCLAFVAPQIHVLDFPAWDCLPYDRVSPHQSIMARRIGTLTTLATRHTPNSDTMLLLTTPSALMQRVVPHSFMVGASFVIEAGKTLNLSQLQHYLGEHGYRRTGKVMEPSEYAIRGNILDIFPSGADTAARIDLFGDEVESIASMDPMTQRSMDNTLKKLALSPAGEVTLNEASIKRFRERYRDMFGAAHRDDALYAAISASQTYAGMEHWLPLFYEATDTLFDYVGDARITLGYGVLRSFTEREELIQDYYAARVEAANVPRKKDGITTIYHPLPPQQLYVENERIGRGAGARPRAAILTVFCTV